MVAAFLGAVLSAIGFHTYLPMNDASSHLATAVIARELLRGEAFFTQHYFFQWVPVPYWGVTVALLPLLSFLAPLLAFSVLVAAYVVLVPLSFYLVTRSAGRGNELLTPVAVLASLNWAYWLGEASFLLGQPLVLLAFALFLRMRRVRSAAFAGFVVLSVLVYLCHVFALAALLVAVVSLAPLLWTPLQRATVPGFRWNLPRALAAAVVALLFVAAGYFVVFQHGSTSNQGTWRLDLSLRKLAQVGLAPLSTPDGLPNHVSAAFLVLVAGVLVVPRLRRGPPGHHGESPVEPVLLLPAVGLVGAAFLAPQRLLDPSGALKDDEIAIRFCLCAFLFCLAAARVPPSRGARVVLIAAIAAFGALKLGTAWSLHHRYDARMREVSALLARIPQRSRLLPVKDVERATEVDNLYHRAGNYVVVERHSYSPHVFAVLGQQPMRHTRWGDYRSVSKKLVSDVEWAYYDYLLVQTDRATPDVPGLELHGTLIGQARPFLLYRLNRGERSR